MRDGYCIEEVGGMSDPAYMIDPPEVRGMLTCYGCGEPVRWLAPDGRCCECTRCVPEDVE